MNTQEPKHQFVVEVLVMLFLTVLWVTCALADTAESPLVHRLTDRGTFSTVKTTDDIPEGKCCFVKDYPIDKMALPEPHLLCKTNNTIVLDDVIETH